MAGTDGPWGIAHYGRTTEIISAAGSIAQMISDCADNAGAVGNQAGAKAAYQTIGKHAQLAASAPELLDALRDVLNMGALDGFSDCPEVERARLLVTALGPWVISEEWREAHQFPDRGAAQLPALTMAR